MGVHPNIGMVEFPKQGTYVGRKCKVAFNYEFDNVIYGVLVRDDREDPHRTIIQLDDGRYVMGTECQYSLVYDPDTDVQQKLDDAAELVRNDDSIIIQPIEKTDP